MPVVFFFIKKEIVHYEISPNKVDALDTQFTQIYKGQKFQPYRVDGQVTGQFKNAGMFSYVRIYGAGHEVAAYKVSFSFFVPEKIVPPKLMTYDDESLVNWLMAKPLLSFSHR